MLETSKRNLVEYLVLLGRIRPKRSANWMPKLDDWRDGHPDAWDYEARAARETRVTVDWDDQLTSDGKTFEPAPPDLCGWDFSWKHGKRLHIGQTSETNARKAAAPLHKPLAAERSVLRSATSSMDGYICFLERQEDTSLTFSWPRPTSYSYGEPFFRLTRENLCTRELVWTEGSTDPRPMSWRIRIIKAPGPVADNEEIICTFTKRRKS